MKKVSPILSFFTLIFISLAVMTSCGGNDNKKALDDSKRIDSLNSPKKDIIEFKFLSTEANLPSPFQVVTDIYNFKAPYKAELLNPSDNADNYISAYKKAVNFGVYGIDQAYINVYGHNIDQMNYYASSQMLAEGLNMESVFNKYAERLKANEGNNDSVARILDNAFTETDAYLKKNERFLVASHIMAGALIEVNFLSINLLKSESQTKTNDSIFQKVYNENLYIVKLISLFKEYKDKESSALYQDMCDYEKDYNDLIKTSADFTPANIDKLIIMINKVRNHITVPSK